MIHLLLIQPPHLHEIIGLDHREIIVRQIPLPDQSVRKFFINAVQLAVPRDSSLNLFFKFFLSHDLDVPATKLARESHILASATDCQRKLILTDQHDRTPHHLTEDHLVDFSRLQGISDQYLRIFVVSHDVDTLTSQLINNILDSIPPNPHASAHAVDSLINAAHRDLASVSRFARDRVDIDDAIRDLRNLLFEKPLHQKRSSPA